MEVPTVRQHQAELRFRYVDVDVDVALLASPDPG